ncbi:hypothetical protein FFWV33_04470 [Flavobacterium faecale]|uniref:Uncharacterized protein n=1 Tax=Flavobacterium faecale TaxID=1355330 RepID=A0A2S1LAS0_9FLAO|nr:DUF6327 family protein [Flavobacterium faecale]AWG20849.1 hypothetical protein FFWV33_04470 [Flavobacterium faecale]
MEKKIYSSFEQIEADLEILDIEKQINYQKIILGVQKTKQQFTPSGITRNIFDGFTGAFTGSYSNYYKLAVPLIIKWMMNKKRSQ